MKKFTILLTIGLAFIASISLTGCNNNPDKISSTPISDPEILPAPADEIIVCTQEAKQCPDGTYVGRIFPNCEFAKCLETPMPHLEDKIDNSSMEN